MNNIDRCSLCPVPPNYVPKPIPPHRYGDYIVLRPDSESCQKLKQLAEHTQTVVSQESGVPKQDITPSDPSRFHLTLAMPLSPMTNGQIKELTRAIDRSGAAPFIFDCVFRGPQQGGSYGFSASSPNFAPGVDLRLNRPESGWKTHDARPAHDQMTRVATAVQKYCEQENLVDSQRNSDGKCNPFHPHVTLGNINAEDSSQKVHQRTQHRDATQNAISYLLSQKANLLFPCSQHEKCGALQLKFDKVEILRVDDQITTTLASKDLKTSKWTLNQTLPSCSHEAQPPLTAVAAAAAEPAPVVVHSDLNLLRDRIGAINMKGSFWLTEGKDHKGKPMIEVRMSVRDDAKSLLNACAYDQKENKIYTANGSNGQKYYSILLGPTRLQRFGLTDLNAILAELCTK